MKGHSKRSIQIFVILIVIGFGSSLLAQENVIRYKRYEKEEEVLTYFTIGGEYAIEDQTISAEAGLIIDLKISDIFMLTGEGLTETSDFSAFSFNVGAIVNVKIARGDTEPFIGAGISMNIPTSRTLSTELVLKGNLGLLLSRVLRISAYYATPIDHLTKYNYVGINLGIKINI